MKAYPEYKSVSAEEKIIYPSHWQCVKPKFFVSLDKGRKPNDTSFDNTGLPPYLTMDVLRGRDTLVQYPFSSDCTASDTGNSPPPSRVLPYFKRSKYTFYIIIL